MASRGDYRVPRTLRLRATLHQEFSGFNAISNCQPLEIGVLVMARAAPDLSDHAVFARDALATVVRAGFGIVLELTLDFHAISFGFGMGDCGTRIPEWRTVR